MIIAAEGGTLHLPTLRRQAMEDDPRARAGCDVLKEGGTAVEACIATAAAPAVVYPHITGIGDDGFWPVSEPDGRVHAIHGCGRAAADIDLSRYAEDRAMPWRGPLAAITVAGTVSAWEAAREFVEPYSDAMGHAGALVRHPSGRLEGAIDPRSRGMVAAW